MIPLEQLPHELDRAKLTCQAIVEAPAGTRVKVYYDSDSHRFRVGKFLPLGMVFPVDFSFVPSTLGGDGDPLDLLILPEASLPVGAIVEVRLLGVLEVEQRKANKRPKRNDRVIGRLTESRLFAELEHINQLGEKFVRELSVFFQTYKALRGQTHDVLSIGGPERAVEIIEAAADEFRGQAERPEGSVAGGR
jgi:inorganic pyrophosphatase